MSNNTGNEFIEDDDGALILTDEIVSEEKPSFDENNIDVDDSQYQKESTHRTKFYSDNSQKNLEDSIVAVVGAGTIGSLISGLFMRSGNRVLCFSSPSSSRRITAEGITIASEVYDDFSFRPEIAYLAKKKPEVIILSTRSTHVDIAMTALHKRRVENAMIIAVTSGIEYLKNLKNDYGFSVSVGFVEPFWAYREDVNRIVHKDKKLRLIVANDKTIERNRLEAIADKFKFVGIDFQVMDSVTDLIWLKATSSVAISLVSTMAGEAFPQAIKDKTWFDCMEKIIWESLAVAKKEGSKISYEDVIKIINNVPTDYKPPLLLDFERGQIGELDAIAGDIIRLANKYELHCPTIQKIISYIMNSAPKYYEVRISPYL